MYYLEILNRGLRNYNQIEFTFVSANILLMLRDLVRQVHRAVLLNRRQRQESALLLCVVYLLQSRAREVAVNV